MGKYAGRSKLALRPKSTEQVSKVLAYCNDRRLAIVPQVQSSLQTPTSKPAQRSSSAFGPCLGIGGTESHWRGLQDYMQLLVILLISFLCAGWEHRTSRG